MRDLTEEEIAWLTDTAADLICVPRFKIAQLFDHQLTSNAMLNIEIERLRVEISELKAKLKC